MISLSRRLATFRFLESSMPSRPASNLISIGRLLLTLITAWWIGSAAAWAGPAPPPSIPDPAALDARAPIRGMTVSCPTWGPIWGSPKMANALNQLSGLGVEWVSIHPYAHIRRNGQVQARPIEEMDFLRRAVRIAERAGMRLFWKPHLAYWGSFDWRGAIEFGDDPAVWRRFFQSYTEFIVEQAAFAERHDVPIFSVGLEYEATTHHEEEWRALIHAVRQVYTGKLTYSANWDRVSGIPFWDALDLISVQGYFPLASGEDTHPDREQIRRRWDRPIQELRALHETYGKPVLFAEIGYDLGPKAAVEPWLNETHTSSENLSLRKRLLEVAIERLEAEPFIAGMFWWKWIPGASPKRDFAMQHPDALDVLRRAWGEAAPSTETRESSR